MGVDVLNSEDTSIDWDLCKDKGNQTLDSNHFPNWQLSFNVEYKDYNKVEKH